MTARPSSGSDFPTTGADLRALRVAAGLTQEELAKRLGVLQQRIATAERQQNVTAALAKRWVAACASGGRQ